MFADLQPVLLFILTLVFSIILLASCKDDVIQTNTNTNPLVGEWYEVGSTENRGTKVVFTETNFKVVFYFVNQHLDPVTVDIRTLYNEPYSFIFDNEIEIKTIAKDPIRFTLNNDTLVLHHIPLFQVGPPRPWIVWEYPLVKEDFNDY